MRGRKRELERWRERQRERERERERERKGQREKIDRQKDKPLKEIFVFGSQNDFKINCNQLFSGEHTPTFTLLCAPSLRDSTLLGYTDTLYILLKSGPSKQIS